ncbi:predicted protein [Scheffersomyces stipitis CBS 6054]|uniref:Golgi SNAP receptor complex member 1 n=1 Tax=Scheffersomyces stipitis (strain ATCC 58785 / CBS 6054 / NBRC 10063 / NRRL Y-11545) TaxID=322104 RepID=A3LPH8_PICST|nr:predicted protein [Scheffersomyces stipitis CBS 6054]ABN65048.2 predicted protein [Scheffersomyces stipitis CBS 6054]KAG2736783.1 hypothetical protein G9P44_000873 [Scheffersomyces stipitis]
MSSSTFSQTRSQALSLEKQTETLLARYSNFQNQSSVEATDEESQIFTSIQETLEKRDATLAKLNRISDSMDTLSTSKLQQLTRHKEILSDHKASFNKIAANIEEERNRNNLLFSVRSDINAHRQQRAVTDEINGNDYVLEERQRVDNANTFADRLLNSAYQTRDELYNQRQYLNNAQSKMFSTLQQIPGINVLISKINTRRKRDTFILATVIAACILLLFFF